MAWISTKAGARRAHMHPHSFKIFAEATGVRKQFLPGLGIGGKGLIRWNEADVDKVIRESVIEPGKTGEAVAS